MKEFYRTWRGLLCCSWQTLSDFHVVIKSCYDLLPQEQHHSHPEDPLLQQRHQVFQIEKPFSKRSTTTTTTTVGHTAGDQHQQQGSDRQGRRQGLYII